jgi:hypothetical protein
MNINFNVQLDEGEQIITVQEIFDGLCVNSKDVKNLTVYENAFHVEFTKEYKESRFGLQDGYYVVYGSPQISCLGPYETHQKAVSQLTGERI